MLSVVTSSGCQKMASPHVTVIVLNWNGWRETLPCLDSMAVQKYQNMSIIVVDNASKDDSKNRIVAWPGNAGNNLGIRLALEHRSNYVWILNNDTEVHSLALDALVQSAEQDPAIGMCGSVLVYHDARDQIQAIGGVNFNYWRAMGEQIGHGLDPQNINSDMPLNEPLSYIAGASLLARAEMILEVGTFEERYFLYFEEIDWAERAKGWKIAVSLDSVVYHKEGASIGTASRSRRSVLSQYYLNRNVLLFYARFHKLLLPVAIARVVRELLRQMRMKDWPLLGATWRALIDGILSREGRTI